LQASEDDLTAQLDRTIGVVADVAASQQAYVLPGQAYEQGLEHVSGLLQQLGSETAALPRRVRAIDSPDRVRAVADAAKALIKTDATVRAHLDAGNDLMAADLILGEGRTTATAMFNQLAAVRAGEARAFAVQRADLWRQLWTVL